MQQSRLGCSLAALLAASAIQVAHPFVLAPYHRAIAFVITPSTSYSSSLLWTQSPSTTTTPSVESFIDGELRSAAMKLHTKEQAPREGQAPSKNLKPYVTTHADYLQFLVDSQHVYQAFEDVVNQRSDLAVFRNTGLERTKPLEQDIAFMCEEYNLPRPAVAQPGIKYANTIREIESVPEFVCHYYNFYFAHTAGGRMIGKQMSALLLDNKTLEFYKWEGDLNEMKAKVKGNIDEMAAKWTPEQREECVATTAATFEGAGPINGHLMGGQSPN